MKWRVTFFYAAMFRTFNPGFSRYGRVSPDEVNDDGYECLRLEQEAGNREPHFPHLIGSTSPPSYPAARLLPSIARFRFTQVVQFRRRDDGSPVISAGLGKRFHKTLFTS